MKECIPGAKVTVIAEHYFNETTTFGAAGLWEPYQISNQDSVNKWGKIAWDHFLKLYYGPDAGRAGVQMMTAYQLYMEGEVKKNMVNSGDRRLCC